MTILKNGLNSTATQYATFFCGDSLLGMDIRVVQEINRSRSLTRVPRCSSCVRGVMNLRGEVVTMLDLRTLMSLPKAEPGPQHRNLIIQCDEETFGLWVDGVADIIAIEPAQIAPPPSNLSIAQSKLIRGVFPLESRLILLVDPRELLAASMDPSLIAA